LKQSELDEQSSQSRPSRPAVCFSWTKSLPVMDKKLPIMDKTAGTRFLQYAVTVNKMNCQAEWRLSYASLLFSSDPWYRLAGCGGRECRECKYFSGCRVCRFVYRISGVFLFRLEKRKRQPEGAVT